MKLLKFLKKHLKAFIIIVVLIIAVVVGLNIYKSKKMEEAMSEVSSLQTETVERQTISNYVSMTGSITANDSQTVYSTINGVEVLAVNVEVGDTVQKGDVIAVLDSSTYEDKLASAEKELSVANAKQQIELQQAARNLNQANVDALDNAKEQQTSVDRAATDYGYIIGDKEDAYEDYQDALEDVEDAKDEYEKAKDKLKKLRKGNTVNYDGVEYDPDDTATDAIAALKKVVENKKDAVESAEDKAETALRQYTNAQESMEKNYRNYDDAIEKQADTAEDAQRKIQDAQDSLTIKQLESTVSSRQSEDNITEYKKQIDKCTIKAPISGVITSVDMEVGDETATDNNTICVIQDVTGYKVEGTVDEYDVAKVKEGMTAVIKTEASSEELKGVVSFISPTPKTSSNSNSQTSSSSSAAVYPIKVTLEGINDDVRIGMTAETNVLIDTAEEVLTVPYDCVVEKEDGTFVVYAVDDKMKAQAESEAADTENADGGNSKKKNGGFGMGGPGMMGGPGGPGRNSSSGGTTDITKLGREIVVTKGLETDYYTEISGDGIEEGMAVYVPESESSGSETFMMMGGGPGGF